MPLVHLFTLIINAHAAVPDGLAHRLTGSVPLDHPTSPLGRAVADGVTQAVTQRVPVFRQTREAPRTLIVNLACFEIDPTARGQAYRQGST